jgi:hypothetical protein
MKWRRWTTKKKQLEIISTHQHDKHHPSWVDGMGLI